MDQQLQVLKSTVVANAWNATLHMRSNISVSGNLISSVGREAQHVVHRNPIHHTEIPVVEAVPVNEAVALKNSW
jgi:hypothetical protein